MVNDITNNVSLSQTGASVPRSKGSTVPTKPSGGGQGEIVDPVRLSAEAREALAREQEAAQASRNNVPRPLGDTTAVVYKDKTGELITQYRNRATGEVNTIPDPNEHQFTSTQDRNPTPSAQRAGRQNLPSILRG